MVHRQARCLCGLVLFLVKSVESFCSEFECRRDMQQVRRPYPDGGRDLLRQSLGAGERAFWQRSQKVCTRFNIHIELSSSPLCLLPYDLLAEDT